MDMATQEILKKVERFDILNVKISAINLSQACAILDEYIYYRKKGYVCVSPVSTIMECQRDKRLLNIVNSATLTTPDGMPSVWIGKRKGFKHMGRVYGPDLMLALCDLSQQKGYSHYFYGATTEVLDKLKDKFKKRFPALKIVGSYAPPFRALSPEEGQAIAEEINKLKPDVVWVGLGSPKQDYWMAHYRPVLEAPMFLGVGAAFDFLSDCKPQAPRWMQRIGLEWLFRLACEPQRLWRRYLIGNTKFIYLLIKEYLRGKRQDG